MAEGALPAPAAATAPTEVAFIVNGHAVSVAAAPLTRLSDVLRRDLGLTGTKAGCDAGDCGACTVLVEGRQLCACLVPVARVEGCLVVTVEGLEAHGTFTRVQQAFRRHGAAQCGYCTPGMIMAATELVGHKSRPSEAEVRTALGGVLCRCTGYRQAVAAVLEAATERGVVRDAGPAAGAAVGSRAARIDATAKVSGATRFVADTVPADALWLRVVRSPHPRARFTLGDLGAFIDAHPGLERVLAAADVPGTDRLGDGAEAPPLLAEGKVGFAGQAVLALVGDRAAVEAVQEGELPIDWHALAPLPESGAGGGARDDDEEGMAAPEVSLTDGDAEAGLAAAAAVVGGDFEIACAEHACIELDAAHARRAGEAIEVAASGANPGTVRERVARVLALPPERVRLRPLARGGAFGRRDASLAALVALAAWRLERPVACIEGRRQGMAASAKRPRARISARLGCDGTGRLAALEWRAVLDLGAGGSQELVARTPALAAGPYLVPALSAVARGAPTAMPPAAFLRGPGAAEAAVVQEALMDELADALGRDRLELRRANALPADGAAAGPGLASCLEALEPHWRAALAEPAPEESGRRWGVGIACACLGPDEACAPARARIALAADGALTLAIGAADAGQGTATAAAQVAADALGVEMGLLEVVTEPDLAPEGGAGGPGGAACREAVRRAADALGARVRELAGAGAGAELRFEGPALRVCEGGRARRLDIGRLAADGVTAEGSHAGSTDARAMAFAAQLAVVEVDLDLGTVEVLKVVAAQQVGGAVNPTLIEGQVHGGVAQGLGMALMEEYLPGRGQSLRDYLIPTAGDVPEIEVILLDAAPGSTPAGVGVLAFLPAAAAILGAVRHAIGAPVRRLPALPHRVRQAIAAAARGAR